MRKSLRRAFDRLSEAVKPLREAPYSDVVNDASAYGHIAWSDVREDQRNGGTRWHAPDAPRVWVIAMCGDYVGSDLDAANQVTLRREFPGLFVTISDSMGAEGLAIIEGRSYRASDIMRLAETLMRLHDYPLLSDEDHSEYVSELAEAAWIAWLCFDVSQSVAELVARQLGLSDEDELKEAIEQDGAAADVIRSGYYEDAWWTCEGASTVINEQHAESIARAARCYLELLIERLQQQSTS